MERRLLIPIVAAASALATAPAAGAEIPGSLSGPASCAEHVRGPLDYWICDDGVPNAGGTQANESGARAITVPARYLGWAGLPPKAESAGAVPGANAEGDIALDVDISLPRSAPPKGGYPLLFMMHGCCGGDKTGWEDDEFGAGGQHWHYSNAWFASRGYVVVNYTSRGFVNGEGNGSTGVTQLQARSYEINDYQHLACQVAGAAPHFGAITGRKVRIDPKRVVTTGGSYGAGFSWMTVTDPKWQCPRGTGAAGGYMKLAASAPMYGWTDLVYSLVPTGAHSQRPGHLPATDGCDTGPLTLSGEECPGARGTPLGVPKTSILAGLYASGKTGLGVGEPHTTFPPAVDQAMQCLNGSYPPLPGPLCDGPVNETLPGFLRERSAYYQDRFFRKIRKPGWRVPVFSAATFTDPLFPPIEHIRMTNRLHSVVPHYPIQSYNGDYQHFVQNKAKEWSDLCGADHHACIDGDYPKGGARPADFSRAATGRRRTGVTTMLNRFIDHYARPSANRKARRPDFDSTVSLQVCPQNATERWPLDEPGPRFRARSFAAQARRTLTIELPGSATTTSSALPNRHALLADPVANQLANDAACASAEGEAGPGVAGFESEPLAERAVMIGATRVALTIAGGGDAELLGLQLAARMYDLAPNGTTALVDRGMRRLETGAGRIELNLHGNGWLWRPGHRILLELAQDDAPYLHLSTPPSSLSLSDVTLRVPVR